MDWTSRSFLSNGVGIFHSQFTGGTKGCRPTRDAWCPLGSRAGQGLGLCRTLPPHFDLVYEAAGAGAAATAMTHMFPGVPKEYSGQDRGDSNKTKNDSENRCHPRRCPGGVRPATRRAGRGPSRCWGPSGCGRDGSIRIVGRDRLCIFRRKQPRQRLVSPLRWSGQRSASIGTG